MGPQSPPDLGHFPVIAVPADPADLETDLKRVAKAGMSRLNRVDASSLLALRAVREQARSESDADRQFALKQVLATAIEGLVSPKPATENWPDGARIFLGISHTGNATERIGALARAFHVSVKTARRRQADMLEALAIMLYSQEHEVPHQSGRIERILPSDLIHFRGRETELAEIHVRLVDGRPSRWHVIHGLGGVGKTRLAAQYARSDGAHHFRIVWWVRAEDSAQLRSDLLALADAAGLPGAPTPDKRIGLLLTWLNEAAPSPWLLIFDNATGPLSLQEEISHVGPAGRCLVTSTNTTWRGLDPSPRQLHPLALDQAAEYFASRSGRQRTAEVDQLCDELGCLPLALSQAASTVEVERLSVKAYLRMLRGPEIQEVLEGWPGERHPSEKPVAATWRLAMDSAAQRHPGAKSLLELAAFMAPERIGVDVLCEAPAGLLPPEIGSGHQAVHRCRAELARFSLINEQDPEVEDAFSLHRLVQAVVRMRLKPGARRERIGQAAQLLLAAMPEDPSQPKDHAVVAPLVLHAETVARHANAEHAACCDAAELLSLVGLFRRGRSDWAAAERAHAAAVELCELRHDVRDASGVMRLLRYGNVLRQNGKFGEAEAIIDRGMALLDALPEVSPLQTARALSVLGRLRRRQDRIGDAVGHLHRATAVLEATGGNSTELSRILKHYARVLRLYGRHDEAERRTRQAIQVLGARQPEDPGFDEQGVVIDPALADHYGILGAVLRDRGRLRAALVAQQCRLYIQCTLHPTEIHSDVGSAYESTGRVRFDLGDFDTAGAAFAQAREIAVKTLGPRYAHVATAMVGQALIANAEGKDPDDARRLLEDAIAIYSDAYNTISSRTDPSVLNLDTAGAMLHLARWQLEHTPDTELEQAAATVSLVLQTRQLKLPPRHFHLASCLHLEGRVAGLRGDPARALALHEDARSIRVEAFGTESHHLVAESFELVGDHHLAAGGIAAAREAYLLSATIRREVLGEASPWTLAVVQKHDDLLTAL